MRLRPATFVVAVFLATALLGAQQPTFRSGVDLIRLDVRVVADDGTPVRDLSEDDFEVRVNGKPCPIRTLQFLDFSVVERPSIELQYRDVSTNAASMRGRLTVIVLDESSLPEDSRPLMNGIAAYLKKLGPEDQTALVALPRPGIWKDFTTDSAELQALLLRSSSRVTNDVSTRPLQGTQVNADGSMVAVRGDVAVDRGESAAQLFPANSALDPNRDIIYALEALARRLRTVEGPKTMILVSSKLSESIALDDYHAFADAAAAARLTVYVLKPNMFNASASGNTSALEPQFQPQGGIDFLAGMTGGIVLNAVGSASGVLDHISRETSGNYVIGVEPPPGAPRNKPLNVSVKVTRAGLTVRSPKQVVTAAPGSRKLSATPKEALGNLLHEPRLATDLPLKVTSYTAQGVDFDRMKALIVAELGEVPDNGDVAWGFEVHDGGRIISDAFDKVKIRDAAAEPIVTSASLPPGKYTMRFGMVDDHGRRASVDHPISVGLHVAGSLEYSDVFAGVAEGGHFKPRITVDPSSGQLVAIVEVYGASKDAFENVSVEFGLRGADGINRAATRARVQAAATSGVPKGLAQAAMPLARVTPGVYDVTAAVLVGNKPVGFTRREVVIGQGR